MFKWSVIHNYGVIQKIKSYLSRLNRPSVVWSLAPLPSCDECPGGQRCWLCFVAAVCHMCSRWFNTTQAATLSTWSALFVCTGTSMMEACFECKNACCKIHACASVFVCLVTVTRTCNRATLCLLGLHGLICGQHVQHSHLPQALIFDININCLYYIYYIITDIKTEILVIFISSWFLYTFQQS